MPTVARSARQWGGSQLPPFAVVKRREVLMQPDMTAAARNVRPYEIYSPHEAPEAPRQGDTPARPSRMPIVTFSSAAAIRAVMEDDFRLSIVAPYPGAQPLGGRQAPWGERLNIHKRSAEAYGSLLTLNPPDYWHGQW